MKIESAISCNSIPLWRSYFAFFLSHIFDRMVALFMLIIINLSLTKTLLLQNFSCAPNFFFLVFDPNFFSYVADFAAHINFVLLKLHKTHEQWRFGFSFHRFLSLSFFETIFISLGWFHFIFGGFECDWRGADSFLLSPVLHRINIGSENKWIFYCLIEHCVSAQFYQWIRHVASFAIFFHSFSLSFSHNSNQMNVFCETNIYCNP